VSLSPAVTPAAPHSPARLLPRRLAEPSRLSPQGRKGFYFHYWALFDGHAGTGAAVMASKRLHLHICEQLRDLVDILQDPSPPPICLPHDARASPVELSQAPLAEDDGEVPNDALPRFHLEKAVSHESLVIGAIENAFKHMVSEPPPAGTPRYPPGASLCHPCLPWVDPSGERQLCSEEGAAGGLTERAPRCCLVFGGSGCRGFGLWTCVGAEGFIALCSSSSSRSPPVLPFPGPPSAAAAPGLPGEGAQALAGSPPPPRSTPRCCQSRRVLFWLLAALLAGVGPAACPAQSHSLSPQDDEIERERASQRLSGGCCALAAVYLMGKFYVANAGDSRYGPAGQPLAFTR